MRLFTFASNGSDVEIDELGYYFVKCFDEICNNIPSCSQDSTFYLSKLENYQDFTPTLQGLNFSIKEFGEVYAATLGLSNSQ